MPNNRRGFGGVEYVFYEEDEIYFESLRSVNWPTSPDKLKVGGIWRDGTTLRTVILGDNLLVNGDFEANDFDPMIDTWGEWDWYTPTTTPSIVSGAIDTAQALQVAFTVVGDDVGYDITLELGKRYQLSGFVQAVVGTARVIIQEELSPYNKAGKFASLSYDDFEYFEIDFVAQTTSYRIQLLGTSVTDVHNFDELELREVI